MNARALLATVRLIGKELCARTANDHTPLARCARVAPITGHPITGWARVPVS